MMDNNTDADDTIDEAEKGETNTAIYDTADVADRRDNYTQVDDTVHEIEKKHNHQATNEVKTFEGDRIEDGKEKKNLHKVKSEQERYGHAVTIDKETREVPMDVENIEKGENHSNTILDVIAQTTKSNKPQSSFSSKSRKLKNSRREMVSKPVKHTLTTNQADDSDFFASSDDNIPLKQILIDKKPNHEDKDDIEEVYDSGDYFKPSKDDYNSSDSNLSFPSSESNKFDDISYIKKKKKKRFNRRSRKVQLALNHCHDDKQHIECNSTHSISIPTAKEFQTAVNNEIQVPKQLRAQESLFNQIVTEHHAKRLDNLLFVKSFERKDVSPDGNYFSSQFYHTLHQ